jgi:hypothetical protein
MIAKRFIVLHSGATPYIAAQGVQGVVTVPVQDVTKSFKEGEPTLTYLDVLLDPDGSNPTQDALYHAVMNDDGSITVVTDELQQTFPHTFAGWPIPGPYVRVK